jgi:hypothetical protein
MPTTDRVCADRNYEWFKRNLPALADKYDDRYVVVKNEAVIASYPSFDEALVETLRTETPGTFIIQLCSLDESKTTLKFYSRVRFESDGNPL